MIHSMSKLLTTSMFRDGFFFGIITKVHVLYFILAHLVGCTDFSVSTCQNATLLEISCRGSSISLSYSNCYFDKQIVIS